MGHHSKSRVRFNPSNQLRHKDSSSLQAIAKFAVLLPLALLFASGLSGTSECIAAPAKHHQNAKEPDQALNYTVANSSAAVPLSVVSEHPVRVSVVRVKRDLVDPAPIGLPQDQIGMVLVGGFEPVSLAQPSLETSLQVVKTEVFGAHNNVLKKASSRGPEKAAQLGSFDRGSDAWAVNGREPAPAEEGSDASSESRTGIDTPGIAGQ